LLLGQLNVLGLVDPPKYTVVVDADDKDQQKLTELLTFASDGPDDQQVKYYPPFATTTTTSPQVDQIVERRGSKFWDAMMHPDDVQMPISDGFYGRPQVASVVYHGSSAPGNNFDLFQQIKDGAGGFGADQSTVVIVGSVVGGTGAGLIPGIARTLQSKGNRKVIGILYGRYFSIPSPAPTDALGFTPNDEMLEANGIAGLEHIRSLFNSPDCPFAAVYCLGHHPEATLATAADISKLTAHSFSGLLLGAALLAPGVRDIEPPEQEEKTRGGVSTCKFYIFTCREKGCLKENDIAISVPGLNLPGRGLQVGSQNQDVPRVGLSNLREMLDPAMEAVRALACLDVHAATDALSIFPRRRLTPAIFDTLTENRSTSRGELGKLKHEIGIAADIFKRAIDELRSWLEQSEAMQISRSEAAVAVQPRSWQESIAATQFGAMQRLARRWVQAAARAQLRPNAQSGPSRFSAANYLLPIPIKRAAGEERSADPVSVNVDTIVYPAGVAERWRLLARSFASPDGRAQAFGLAVRTRIADAVQVSWRLWCGVAAGVIGVEVVDLAKSGPVDGFDAVLRRGTNLDFMIRLFSASDPKLCVGGIHPQYGIWLATERAEIDRFMETLKTLDLSATAPELARCGLTKNMVEMRGALILSQWTEDLKDLWELPPDWLKLVRQQASAFIDTALAHVPDRAGTEARARDAIRDHLRTVGPIEQIRFAGKDTPVYLYQFDQWRRARIRMLAASVASNRLTVDGGRVLDGATMVADTGGQLDTPAGFANVTIRQALPLTGGDATDWHSLGSNFRLANLPFNAVTMAWVEANQRRPFPLTPDLFWNATD